MEDYTLPAGPKLNLGCGPVQPEGWINIDGSSRARLAARFRWLDAALVRLGLLPPTEFGPHITVLDLRRSLPYAESSVAGIYAGELWEHFELDGAARLTKECVRVLAPGGVLRICVPDGAVFWRNYLKLYDKEMAKPEKERCAEPLKNHVGMYYREICTRRPLFGSMGHFHKWQFDEVQLVELLREYGLQEVGRAEFRKSRIPDIERVERSDFLIVEGVKPAQPSP